MRSWPFWQIATTATDDQTPASTIHDAEIRTEIRAQIAAGNLPTPTADTRAARLERDDLERRRRSVPVRARRRRLVLVLGQRLEEAVERLLESPLLLAVRQAS